MNRDHLLVALVTACLPLSCSNAVPAAAPGPAPVTSAAAPPPSAPLAEAPPSRPPPLPRAPGEVYKVRPNPPEHLVFPWTSMELTPGGQLRLRLGRGADAMLLDPAALTLTPEPFTGALCVASSPVKAPVSLCVQGAPVLVVAGPQGLSVERDGQTRSLSPGFPVAAAALSPDGEAVAATSVEGHALVWSTKDGRVLHERPARADLEPVQGVSWLGRGVIALVGRPARLVSLRDGGETVLYCALFPTRPIRERVACATWSGERLDGEEGVLHHLLVEEGTEPATRALQGPKRHRGLLKERVGEFIPPGPKDASARRDLLVRAFASTLEKGRITRQTPHGAFTLLDVESGDVRMRYVVGELGAGLLDAQAQVEREDLDFTGDGVADLLVQDGSRIAIVRSQGPGEILQEVSKSSEERLESVQRVDLLPLSAGPSFVLKTRHSAGPLVRLYARNSVYQGGVIEGGFFPEAAPIPGGRTGKCDLSRSGPGGAEWRVSFNVTGGRIHEFRSHAYLPTGPGQANVEESYLPFVGGDASSGKRLKLSALASGTSSRMTLFDLSFQGSQFAVAGIPGTGTCRWSP